jgi:large conductance mechanosensitive channel
MADIKEEHEPRTEREHKVAAAARAQALKEQRAKLANNAVGKQLTGFMDFVRTQGVVGLAVGLAIGTQANATVKSIVEGLINPIVGFIIGNPKGLSGATWNVIGKDTKAVDYWLSLGDRTLVIGWGAILSALITLLAVAAVIYFVVKGFGLDKLDKKKDA